MPWARALPNIFVFTSELRSRIDWSFSLLAWVSLVIRLRSGRPTEQSSTLMRHSSASSILPRPSKAQAFLNQALWSSGSILIAESAASIASVQYSSFMHACARFFSTAMCRSMSIWFSLLSAALNFCRASSAWRQLAWASAQLPRSHSMRPSFLHLVPQFMTWASVWMSASLRSFLSSSSFSLASSEQTSLKRTSYSFIMASATWSPPMSILCRRPSNISRFSFSSTHSRNVFFSSTARLSMLFRCVHVIVYFMIGATIRLISVEQSSMSSAISSRRLFMSCTFSYCFSQVFRLESQCCSERSKALEKGFLAAWYQNSGSFVSRSRLGLCRGSVLSSSICCRCHSLSLNLGSILG
mmetsp:Transcript_55821/g.179177  ORF Transcript_55821/g.179177 Transcript_55821/m.179177 type:complete len:355 (-) Transcript_55821:640-1704(-)